MVGVLGCEPGSGSIFSPDIFPHGLAPLLGGESGFDAHMLSVNLSRHDSFIWSERNGENRRCFPFVIILQKCDNGDPIRWCPRSK